MAEEVAGKGPWYKSRTAWVGILTVAYQVVPLLPIPEVQIVQAVIFSVGAALGFWKAREVAGDIAASRPADLK